MLFKFKLMIMALTFIFMIAGCGGGGSDAAVVIVPAASPEKVVEQAMQAQVDGDIDEFLDYCALDGASTEQMSNIREALSVVKENIILSEFGFEPLAKGTYKEDTVAIVRAINSYTINANEAVKSGVLVYLKKEDKAWKIVQIVPDELLNQQIYEDSLLIAKKSAAYFTASTTQPPTLSNINEKLNEWINNSKEISLSTYTKTREGTFAIIGMIPLVGDNIAIGEQVVAIFEDAKDLYDELQSDRVYTSITGAKTREIGLGVVRILVEYIPGADTQADLLGSLASNMSHNAERVKAKHEFQRVFRGVSVKETGLLLHPYATKVPGYKYPDGLMTFLENISVREFPTLYSVNVSKPEWIGLSVPLRIYGYLEADIEKGWFFKDQTVEAAALLALGGEKVGPNTIRLAVDITPMFNGISESIIDLPDEFIDPSSIPGKISCYRGSTPFFMTLSNDERTADVLITTIINDVNTLNIQTGIKDINDEDVLNLYIGSTAESTGADTAKSLTVFATTPEETFDIASKSGCLKVHIEDEDIALHIQGDALTSVKGVSVGETALSAQLGSETDAPRDSINVVVQVPAFVDMYHGVIRSVVDNSPSEFPSCLESTGDDDYVLVAENGGLFEFADEGIVQIGQISGDQVSLELYGDIFEGTISNGNWHDSSYCSGTYSGTYSSLAEIKGLMDDCEGDVECANSTIVGYLRQLIEYKEASLQ